MLIELKIDGVEYDCTPRQSSVTPGFPPPVPGVPNGVVVPAIGTPSLPPVPPLGLPSTTPTGRIDLGEINYWTNRDIYSPATITFKLDAERQRRVIVAKIGNIPFGFPGVTLNGLPLQDGAGHWADSGDFTLSLPGSGYRFVVQIG